MLRLSIKIITCAQKFNYLCIYMYIPYQSLCTQTRPVHNVYPLLNLLDTVHVYNIIKSRLIRVCNCLASYPGLHAGGGEKAWYTLFAHACNLNINILT